MKEFMVEKNESGQRIDRFLSKLFENTTRNNLYKLLRKKIIRLNGRKASPDMFVHEGDVVSVRLADEVVDGFMGDSVRIEPEAAGLDIVYEDSEILVVNKPKGLLTHPDKREYANTLSSRVAVYLKPYCGRTFKPAPVQRLDKNTSGLVLFGKTYGAMKKYNALMRERAFKKTYLAVVEGRLESPGEVRSRLVKDEAANKVYIDRIFRGEAKSIHTRYKPLKVFEEHTLVAVELVTGRSHQIRASMASIGHPIVGDTKYGGSKRFGVTTQLLHAWKMEVDGRVFECESPEIESFLEKIKRKGSSS